MVKKYNYTKKANGKNNTGAPSTFKEEYIQKVDEYLRESNDEYIKLVKYESENSTGYEQKLKVNLPSKEKFANYINTPYKTMIDWTKENKEFSLSLEKIEIEQKNRLLDNGLSGDYNSTIAKLILSSNHGMKEKSEVEQSGTIQYTPIDFSTYKKEKAE